MEPRHTKLAQQFNQPNLYSGGRCPSPEVIYPYPLYKDPAMEKLKLAVRLELQPCLRRLHLLPGVEQWLVMLTAAALAPSNPS